MPAALGGIAYIMTSKHFVIPKIDWNKITPDRLLVVLLAVTVALFLSERWCPKGWAVLIVVAVAAVTTLYLLVRFVLALVLHSPFQFSVRSLLIFTAVIALSCGWMTMRIQEAVIQGKALGPGSHAVIEGGSLTPAWLRRFLGDAFFEEVVDATHCDYFECGATDEDLDYLKKFKNLQSLHILRNPAITDAALERLRDFKELSGLYLSHTNITDAGLRHIEAIHNLECLSLRYTRVTGTGLKHLSYLEQLRYLEYAGTAISDDGLNNIKELRQLKDLTVDSAEITDARLGFLRGMNNLRFLDISGNPITDTGLRQLDKLSGLEYLELRETNVTDAGLTQLKALKRLTSLGLARTNVTDEGLKAISGCENLTNLDLQETRITDAGLQHLSAMKQLDMVNLWGTSTTIPGIEKVAKVLPNARFITKTGRICWAEKAELDEAQKSDATGVQ